MAAEITHRNRGVSIALYALTFSLFPLWGVGHRLYDTLIPQFVKVFGLGGFELALAGGLYSVTYFVGAIPAALCARRFGYKTAIVFALGIACVGAFLLYPAGETHSFPYFLSAAAVMSLGWVLLEVSANPLVMAVGSREKAIQRLNLAQSFYVPGSIAGMLVGRWLLQVHANATGASLGNSITHPYIVFAALLLIMTILVEDGRYPLPKSERRWSLKDAAGEAHGLLSRPLFVFAMLAQGFSVVAMASTWTTTGPMFQAAFAPETMALWGGVGLWSMVLFGAGRFLGTGLMSFVAPARLAAVLSLCGACISLAGFFLGAREGAIALMAGNLFLSILWPTILGLAVIDLGPAMKIGTALICMGGALGGFLHRLITVYLYPASPRYGLLVAAVSYVVILVFAARAARKTTPA